MVRRREEEEDEDVAVAEKAEDVGVHAVQPMCLPLRLLASPKAKARAKPIGSRLFRQTVKMRLRLLRDGECPVQE